MSHGHHHSARKSANQIEQVLLRNTACASPGKTSDVKGRSAKSSGTRGGMGVSFMRAGYRQRGGASR